MLIISWRAWAAVVLHNAPDGKTLLVVRLTSIPGINWTLKSLSWWYTYDQMYVSGAYEHQWAPACTCRYLAEVQVGGCVAWGTVSGGHFSSLCWSWLSRCLKFSIAWGGGGGGGGGAPLPACGCGCIGVGVKWMGIRVLERQLDGFLRPVTDQDRDLTRPDIIMQISHRYQTTPKRLFSVLEWC